LDPQLYPSVGSKWGRKRPLVPQRHGPAQETVAANTLTSIHEFQETPRRDRVFFNRPV